MGQTDSRLTYTELQFNMFHGYTACIRSGGQHFSASAAEVVGFYETF